jgi:hypothetical protein
VPVVARLPITSLGSCSHGKRLAISLLLVETNSPTITLDKISLKKQLKLIYAIKMVQKIKINPTLCNQFSVDGGRNLTMVREKLTQLNEL